MPNRLMELLPNPWSTIHERASSYNKLAKNCVLKEDWDGSRFWYRKKKDALIHAILICGVEFELADDDVRMLGVGNAGAQLHLVREWAINFANFEVQFESACQAMNDLVQRTQSGIVSQSDVASASRRILSLRLGDRRKCNQRIRSVMRFVRSSDFGAALVETRLAQKDLIDMVKELFPKNATMSEKNAIRLSLCQAIRECRSRQLSSMDVKKLWLSIDGTGLTTRRILRDLMWLQNASQAAKVQRDFGKAVRELVRIGDDLLDTGWSDDNDNDGENGAPGGAGTPKKPFGPCPDLSAFHAVKPLHGFIAVKPRKLQLVY